MSNELALHACGKHIEDHAKTLQRLIERRQDFLNLTRTVSTVLEDNEDVIKLDMEIAEKRWSIEVRRLMVKIAHELTAADKILKG